MPYASEDDSPKPFNLVVASISIALPLLLIGGLVLQMSDRAGFYTVPLTDLPSYHYAPLLYVLCLAIGLGVTYLFLNGASVEVPVLASGAMAAAFSCLAAVILPGAVQYFDERRAFSGPTTQETRILRVDGSSYRSGKHSVDYEAMINPYHIVYQRSGVLVDRDAYNAITFSGATYCLSLTVEHAGPNQRLMEPLGEFHFTDLQKCPAGAI